ncbi:MAG TPA: response regulator [Verrucomicrobiae bacterium]|nr:response regulator [Verrucomicrobiae bacterium]
MAAGANLTVLYVEDEENDALLMEMAFKSQGLQGGYRTVNNGQMAIDYLSGVGTFSQRDRYPFPALVLLDLNLPEVHGFEVLKWIRAHSDFRELPVVVFSSSLREDDKTKAQELRADDFISKPNSPALLRNIVRGLKERWGL